MARNNKKGSATPRGGRGGRGRGYQRGGRSTNTTPGRRDFSHALGFSLADEARHTSQHSHWDSHSSLRQKPIVFVSAGTSEPLKQLDDELLETDGHGGQDAYNSHALPVNGRFSASPSLEHRPIGDASTGNIDEAPIEPQRGAENYGREETLESERCDADLFYFDLKGERTPAMPVEGSHVAIPERAEQPSSSSDDDVILFRGRDAPRQAPAPKKSTMALTQMETEIRMVEEDIRFASKDCTGPSNRNTVKPPRHGNLRQYRKERQNEDDELLADYIANMQENGELQNLVSRDSRNTRDLGGSADEVHEADDSPESESGGAERGKTMPNDVKDTPDIPLLQQPPGTSNVPGHDASDDPSSESELDDETLAKLIAGQDLTQIPNTLTRDDRSSSSSSETEDDNPQYNEFDVMDWDRPSLRRKKGKAGRAQLTFDVSDSDLEQTLQAAWKNDRLKKSQRKKQREELRALGMLGKKAKGPDDLRVKYPTGMNMQQVAEEVKDFLLGTDASLSLPPMDTHARKMIHDLANKFNIKSKSTGKADQRRPTLHRTARTLPYVETTFSQAISRINRRYFPRLDIKGKRSKRTIPPQNNAAASYREGEVVGAAAPELGSENRGRAMLEKMGWSSGTALGALDNKGILQPVPQTMKKSKAGLG